MDTFLPETVGSVLGAGIVDQQRMGRGHNAELTRAVLSDGRVVGPDGKAPPVGSTVDVAKATYTNTIGAVELTTLWRDPEFDPAQRAFYYARVLEIPTPRWTTYDAVVYGLELPDEIPRTTQERAYTSAIWYSPGS